MRKDDVDEYYIHGRRVPSVNVKCYRSIWDQDVTDFGTDGIFGPQWVCDNLSEDRIAAWERTTYEVLFEDAESDVLAEFPGTRCYLEGRSGGHFIVDGLPPVAEWDAIMLGRWARVAKFVRSTSQIVPEQLLSLVYLNVYEPMMKHRKQLLSDVESPDLSRALSAARELASATS